MSTDPDTNFSEQTAELYGAIGEFAVKFEHVTRALHVGIFSLLEFAGLKNQRMAQVVVADLTAAPLASMYRGLLAESKELSAGEKKVCDSVFKRAMRLIETRNEIIHATWFVGWASSVDEDVSQVTGYKQGRGKSGSDIKHLAKDADQFREHVKECDLVAEMLLRLYGCILLQRDIAENFVVGADGNVAVP